MFVCGILGRRACYTLLSCRAMRFLARTCSMSLSYDVIFAYFFSSSSEATRTHECCLKRAKTQRKSLSARIRVRLLGPHGQDRLQALERNRFACLRGS